MTVVALTPLAVGGREIQPGEVVPETVHFAGRDRRVDLDRLVARGLAERQSSKSSGSRKTSGKGSAGAE